ncbi:protein SOSEKI 1-like [Mangifera indica]|uniref:protein SOSEKI 1-like n=1 Tax=Mangifera indica TaxID=29780 RepID=UPI001CF9F4F4|nr:protein SOSEKI 1-like [Mangifera indica]
MAAEGRLRELAQFNMNSKDPALAAKKLIDQRALGTAAMNRRRKRMECSTGAGKGNGEVRRIHIVYFLSRGGRIEQPHLIRVQHLTRNGVYLRDIKSWFADMRGKDMPEAFAWSYKRFQLRYKSGYVWQDLMDDDLITPISDNEYVLKGSETIPSSPFDPCAYIERRSCSIFRNNDQNKPSPNKEEIPGYAEDSVVLDSPTKTSSVFYQDLPLLGSERSTLTDDSSLKINEEDKIKERETCENDSSFYTALLNQKQTTNTTANNTSNNDEEKMGKQGSLFSSSRPSFAKSKSYSNGASSMFRNWIKCGAVETKDSVLVSVNRADKACSTKSTNATHPDKMAAEEL